MCYNFGHNNLDDFESNPEEFVVCYSTKNKKLKLKLKIEDFEILKPRFIIALHKSMLIISYLFEVTKCSNMIQNCGNIRTIVIHDESFRVQLQYPHRSNLTQVHFLLNNHTTCTFFGAQENV